MTEYFIDPLYGDDSLDGLTEATAWRTEANWNALSPSAGDKCRLLAGRTFRASFSMPASGSSGSPIVINKYGDGDDPIVSGSDRGRGFSLGSNLITNPSFEDWTSTVLDDWTVVTPGGSDITQETSDISHLDSAAKLECDSGNFPYMFCEELSLDDNTKYRFSLWHKDPVAPEDDETYLTVIIWRTNTPGSLTGQYWDPYLMQWEGNGGLNGYPVESRAWWSSFHLDFDTGPNPIGYAYYHIRVQPYNVSPYNNWASRDFLVDACYLAKITTAGTAEVLDGSFEEWTSGALDNWTEVVGESGSDISEETSDPYDGDSSVEMYVDDAGVGTISIQLYQQIENQLENNTEYTVSIAQKIDLIPISNDARLAVLIWRGAGPPYNEYLTASGTWSGTDFSGYPLAQASLGWGSASMTFNTGPNAGSKTPYYIAVQPYQPANGAIKLSTVGRTFAFDALTLSGPPAEVDNKLTNWSFETWTGSTVDDWEMIQEGDSTLVQHTESRHASKGLYLKIDSDDSDVGIKQAGISLDASTTYRFGCFCHMHETSAAETIELAIQIIRESDGYYWNGSAWASAEANAVSDHFPEWNLLADEFTTGGSDDTYTFYIHRTAGTKTKAREEIYFDLAFLAAKNATNEAWGAYFPEYPKHVWITGTIGGHQVDHHRLHNETQTSQQSGSFHPHPWCWTYDRINKILYINIAEDPGTFIVEASMRDSCVDFNAQSYVKVEGLQCLRPKKYGIDMSYVEVGARSTSVEAEDCTVKFTGSSGILAGYQPETPYEGGIAGEQDHKTPSDIVVDGCEVIRYGEDGLNAVRIADTEMLSDPSFEEWDTSDDLTEWDETYAGGGSPTIARESDDVFQGNYSVVMTTDAGNGDSHLVEQDLLTGLFEDTDKTTATVSIWYKTPDWDSGPFTDIFALFVRRYDSSGAATGQTLKSDGTWDAGGAAWGLIPLPQSLTWTKYSLTFNRPADYADYPIYSFGVQVYVPTKTNAKGHRLIFDQVSFSHGLTDWWSSSSYRVPDCGISVTGGVGLVGGSGSVDIRQNKVDGYQGKINYSMGRNGINIQNGGDVALGAWATIEKNEVTRASHAIAALSNWGDTGKYVGLYRIRYNYVHDTGDDGVWVEGNVYPTCKICYNVIQDVGDNGIDSMNCANGEIYNNTINGGVNESIIIWGVAGGTTASAFVYNNIIRNWGSEWVDGSPGKRRGAAIGITIAGGSYGNSVIDHNMYYTENESDTTDYPFHLYEVQKSWTNWQSYGFDANGSVEDPLLIAPASDDLRITRASPCFENGVDLSSLSASMLFKGIPIYFDYAGAIVDALDYTTIWPSGVVLSTQDTAWDQGAYDEPNPTISDDTASFPTDRSLIGVTAYVVDETNHRIWKGVIISNTGTVLYLDEWEPVFNAEGYYPGGSLPYYVGYIYLYDKTPAYAFINDHWEKNLTEYQLLTNRITAANTIFFKKNLNHGAIQDTDSASMLTDRTSVRIFDGKHRNFQLEHALVTNQEIRIKEITYHGVWTRGKTDQ